MDPKAMLPHGRALLAYYLGDKQAQLLVRRDDGHSGTLSASHFFRTPNEFGPIEKLALENCRGHILDVGAGAGIHSLYLQNAGKPVTAIDISPQAVTVMRKRGVVDVSCSDIYSYEGGTYDTLLMLGHGIGMVETIAGLRRFLAYVARLLESGGQILFDSLDVRHTEEHVHLAYQAANQQAGRYIGEVRFQFEYQGQVGPYCGWLHVDADTLAHHAGTLGWQTTLLLQEDNGDYLARLQRSERLTGS